METESALAALASLSQATRLDAFRRLVVAEPDGLAAGDLARALSVPQNTLSSHLAVLSHAHLVTSERRGRSVVYRANLQQLNELLRFLVEDCCAGRGDICAPTVELVSCCPPEPPTAS